MLKFKVITLFYFTILFLIGTVMCAQTKDEREVRVRLNELSTKAQAIVNDLPKSAKKLRLYKEIDGDKISYEAKFKHHKNRYSVEFDIHGTIEDIEMIVKEKNIPLEVIELYFQSHYDTFSLIKIQKQFINSDSKSDRNFVSDILNGSNRYTTNYEIIAEVKVDSKRDIFELLFNINGEFIGSRVLKATSYEHIRY